MEYRIKYIKKRIVKNRSRWIDKKHDDPRDMLLCMKERRPGKRTHVSMLAICFRDKKVKAEYHAYIMMLAYKFQKEDEERAGQK